jgi:hypothetical protein
MNMCGGVEVLRWNIQILLPLNLFNIVILTIDFTYVTILILLFILVGKHLRCPEDGILNSETRSQNKENLNFII